MSRPGTIKLMRLIGEVKTIYYRKGKSWRRVGTFCLHCLWFDPDPNFRSPDQHTTSLLSVIINCRGTPCRLPFDSRRLVYSSAQGKMNGIFNIFESLGTQGDQTLPQAVFGYDGNAIQVSGAFPGHPIISSQNYFRGDMADTGSNWCKRYAACPVIKYETGFRRRGLP